MLKLNRDSSAYPWITLGICSGLFGLTGLITLMVLRLFNIDSPILSSALLFLFPLTICLILMDVLFLEGEQWIKMILVSGLSSLMMGLSITIFFPIYMILYTIGGNGLVTVMTPVLFYGVILIPCWAFYQILYKGKGLKTGLGSYVKASLPVSLVISLFAMSNPDLIWLGLFMGIGAGLGFSFGRKIQNESSENVAV